MDSTSFKRRDFLKMGGAAFAAALAGRPNLAAGAPTYDGNRLPFGVQLWTVKDDFAADPERILAKLAALGFKGVEFYTAFPGGLGAKPMRAMLDKAGLKAVGYHIGGLNTMSDDDLKRTIEANQIIGNTRMGVSFAMVGGGAFNATAKATTATRNDWENIADTFSALATKLKPHGMVTYYHCHPVDFLIVDGETTWDIFFKRASKNVLMQIDLGHMGTAGVDQVAEMKKFPGRAKTVHIKPANGGDGLLVGDPNDGNLAKWPAIFAACEDKKIGATEWYILEYDGGSMEFYFFFAPVPVIENWPSPTSSAPFTLSSPSGVSVSVMAKSPCGPATYFSTRLSPAFAISLTLMGLGSKSDVISAAGLSLSPFPRALTVNAPCGPPSNDSVQVPMNFAASAAGMVAAVCAGAGATTASRRPNASAREPR